ncbi:MAG TPA: phage holin family protein [Sphingomicrobium sp.]
MLKRTEQGGGTPPPEGADERPIGELVHELVEEGKAYAKAEIDVLKAIAAAKGKALIVPAILFAAAFILALAAVTALAVGVVAALAKFVGPLAAGMIGLLIFAAIAGGCGWYASQRLKRDL